MLVASVYQLKTVLCLQWDLEKDYFPSLLLVGSMLVPDSTNQVGSISTSVIVEANHRPL